MTEKNISNNQMNIIYKNFEQLNNYTQGSLPGIIKEHKKEFIYNSPKRRRNYTRKYKTIKLN